MFSANIIYNLVNAQNNKGEFNGDSFENYVI